MNISSSKIKSHSNRFRNSIILLASLCLVLAVIVGFKIFHIYENDLPSFEQLHNIEPSLKTKIYDRNGILLQEYYNENRILTPFRDMPTHLIDILMASEDQEFYDHWGINIRRIGIVAFKNLLKWRITAGASTITQQLSRMIFLTRKKTFERKIKEALTAIKLERTYSKDELLEMYLNQYYFSRGAYGVAAAARIFFSKSVSELNINDCAILIGMLKGPNINSPLNNPDKSLQARNRVLSSYYSVGKITKTVYDSLRNEPLEINPPEKKIGQAPYFTETVRQYVLKKYGEDVLYSSGLKIYTTLDIDLQKDAEKAVAKKVDTLRARMMRRYNINDKTYTKVITDTVDHLGNPIREYKKIQGALVAIDNSNGGVLAMVGGRSFKEIKYNMAVQAYLQPGSCFKPFLYTACVDNGFRTTDIFDDNPIVLDIPGSKQYRPHNFDYKFKGPLTLRDALRLSRNLIAVRLILKINPEQAIFYARRMGITTPLEAVPSLAVGAGIVHLIEMVSAYSIFPNKGIHIPYQYVNKIVDRYGRVLEDNTSIVKDETLSEQTAYIMTDMMCSVVKNGTGRRSRWMGFTRPAGGKTGTTDNFCDNWFIGYTPQISAGVWIGFEDGKISLGRGQDGSKNGVPIWTEFMIDAHDSLPVLDFEEPEGIVHVDVCLESGEIATDRCLNVRNEIFTDDNQPTSTCHIHPSKGLYVPKNPTAPVDTSDDRTHF
ncbi:MAG: PBP1A family penicillin-binding protein [candidate division Zixibacteria bacterium]|nr:PBP1A family penicillin-binding protein [candidate division Zixibacteria bacterium]